MTRHRKRFPVKTREIENIWIPMPDGTRLAARVWLPADADTRPVPAVLEFIPYRKRDFTAAGDALHHPYLAGHGYAAVRCDLRGNGDSEGLFDDEYSAQELDDGYQVIEWLAKQSWCDGNVGMMGISWGGFNCLQVAALRPPALKAVYSVCSTDDRYSDDVHYMGGCLLNDNLMWGSTMTTFAMRPPDPQIVGDRWRDMWRERLENMPNLVANWMAHQTRDEFWRHGSVCENYADIEAAVYAVGGWADGYTNTVPRLLSGLKTPCRGLIGPWAHNYPWKGVPGPAINGLKDLTRWWDHWLKGVETGIMDEPSLRAWIQKSVPPATSYAERPGYWASEPEWPSEVLTPTVWYLAASGKLANRQAREHTIQIRTEQSCGQTHGEWCPYGYQAELAADQREEDGRSVCFETTPLPRAKAILGAPVLELEVSADKPLALLYARLCDVSPDGASTRVSYGVLNLSHRSSHEHPEPLAPGERYRVRLQLNDIGHEFARGHRIRLALSTSSWPLVWPSPEVATVQLHCATSQLLLPVRKRKPEDRKLPALGQAETAVPAAVTEWVPYHRSRRVIRDYVRAETIVEAIKDRGHLKLDDVGLEISGRGEEAYGVSDDDPLSAWAEIHYRIAIRRDDSYDTRMETRFRLTSTATEFILSLDADAYDGEQRFVSRRFSDRFKRNGV